MVCEFLKKGPFNTTQKSYATQKLNSPIPRETEMLQTNHFDHAVERDVQSNVYGLRWVKHWSNVRVHVIHDMLNQLLLAYVYCA